MATNRYADHCRTCLQPVKAGQGTLERVGFDWRVTHAEPCPPYEHNPSGSPTWRISGGSVYVDPPTGPAPGGAGRVTLHLPLDSDQPAPPDDTPGLRYTTTRGGREVVTFVGVVVAAASWNLYDIDEEEKAPYAVYLWRAATPGEAAPVLEAEAARARRRELATRAGRLLTLGLGHRPDDAQWPQHAPGIRDLPEVPLREAADHHAPRVMVDEPNDVIWSMIYNSRDGDDWSLSNAGGWIAFRHPLTDERRALVVDLRAEYEIKAWEQRGIPADAARPLIAAGWTLADITRARAIRITNAADARLLIEHPPSGWPATWWDTGATGPSFPAADALRLAQAGIGCSGARARRDAGYRTVEEMIAAHPPQVPTDATRIIILPPGDNDRVFRTAEVTSDPALAQAWLDHHPDRWGDSTMRAVAGPMPVHVADTWALWDDGSLTVRCTWLTDWAYDNDSRAWTRRRAPAPTHLSEAATIAVGLVAGASNRASADRAVWHPLRAATTATEEKVAGHRRDDANYGQGTELVKHTFTIPADGGTEQRALWQVTSDSWAMGEDGEYEESYTLHPGETAARRAYHAEVNRIEAAR